jgi:hypothetical protein
MVEMVVAESGTKPLLLVTEDTSDIAADVETNVEGTTWLGSNVAAADSAALGEAKVDWTEVCEPVPGSEVEG